MPVADPKQPRPRHYLEQAALRLRAAGGEAYDQFLNAFAVYSREVTDAVTNSEPGTILCDQGQARAVKKVLQYLTDANK